MAERNATKIRRYCDANGITIPVGFKNAAQRYAVIELSDPPKLIARTWFKQEDVVYYLNHYQSAAPRQILDFKENAEFAYDEAKSLKRIGVFLNP
jgi:hypothetical protein